MWKFPLKTCGYVVCTQLHFNVLWNSNISSDISSLKVILPLCCLVFYHVTNCNFKESEIQLKVPEPILSFVGPLLIRASFCYCRIRFTMLWGNKWYNWSVGYLSNYFVEITFVSGLLHIFQKLGYIHIWDGSTQSHKYFCMKWK